MERSRLALILSTTTLSYFFFIMIYILYDWRMNPQRQWVQEKLKGYGQFFIVAQCNMYFQLANLILHIFGHSFPHLRPSRDFVFTVIALPLSLSTTISFWAFWYLFGKNRVYPEDDMVMYPLWVVHGLHTFSPMVNLLLLPLVKHKYSQNPFLFSYVFIGVYLYGAFIMYLYTGSLRVAFIKKFNKLETGIYYLAFSMFSHLCYAAGYVYNDMYYVGEEYEQVVAARIAEAEREINAAPSPISRTPTPLFIIPRDSPALVMPAATEERDEDSPELVIPSAYRPRSFPRPSTPPSPSSSRSSLGRRRADRKNN